MIEIIVRWNPQTNAMEWSCNAPLSPLVIGLLASAAQDAAAKYNAPAPKVVAPPLGWSPPVPPIGK